MTPRRQRILWVDDEIDMLRPHMLYLEGKGYRVTGVANGPDGLHLVEQEDFDLVLLDEMMPGMGGLAVLEELQRLRPGLPVVMITKSEEEHLMNEALGRRISDYLIKPVNPSQIFLTCKRIFEARGLERGATVREYVRQFGAAQETPLGDWGWREWAAEALSTARWDLALDAVAEAHLRESFDARLLELNRAFGRFVAGRYADWIGAKAESRPLLSPQLLPQKLVPFLHAGRRAALIVIDCLRLDQWLLLEELLPAAFRCENDVYYAILPTATPFARNAIFSGLMPAEIASRHPELWTDAQADEIGRNRFERELLRELLRREGLGARRFQYAKVTSRADAEELLRQAGSYADLDLVATVFTFVDTFAHGRSRDALFTEFAQDAAALRAHLRTWFERSALLDLLHEMARQERVTIVTTDHGSLAVRRPALVGADRQVVGGPRFKRGRALTVDPEAGLLVRDARAYGLPAGAGAETHLFAREDYFFVYHHGRHEHERMLRGSFQHGGISLEEMVVPVATLTPAARG
ncbi:MAG: bifunctional response regulator/alkaline phosphatase family protein [Candidatus Eisenbacteria bacterium]|uniref:Bifunctional response regulator/alkaline phosphatase family protein n=1 Tax=Eiseniibacteriota bacterium TaxID=2212470 RepID=A0A938BQ74_UNCEI|nr:bifunctional response regulator/alkaline phosphatase family protein [Candidatus Eisenbacteria bacterium]